MSSVWSDRQRQKYYRNQNDGNIPSRDRAPASRTRARAVQYKSKRSSAKKSTYRKSSATRKPKRATKPASKKQGIKLIGTTADYVALYGNPFYDMTKLTHGIPKVPDDQFSGMSASMAYQTAANFKNTQDRFHVLGSSRAFGMQGFTVAVPYQDRANFGFQQYVALLPAVTGVVNTAAASYIDTAAMTRRFAVVAPNTDDTRYVSAGMKMHYLGAQQVVSGQVTGSHCTQDFILCVNEAIEDLARGAGLTEDVAANAWIIGDGARQYLNFLTLGFGLWSGQQVNATDAANVQAITRNVFDIVHGAAVRTSLPLGQLWEEFVTSDGTSVRAHTTGTNRPFSKMRSMPCFSWTPTVPPVGVGAFNSRMEARGYEGDFFDERVIFSLANFLKISFPPAGLAEVTQAYDVAWQNHAVGNGMHYMTCNVEIGFTVNGIVMPIMRFVLVSDTDGCPLSSCMYHTDLGLDGQGDGPFFLIEATSQPQNAIAGAVAYPVAIPYRTYYASVEESTQKVDSTVLPTISHVDPSWRQVVALTNGMPTVVKGFSFFGDLWGGVKAAAKFAVANAGSIINLAKNLAPVIA
jgi:hypothetical protein